MNPSKSSSRMRLGCRRICEGARMPDGGWKPVDIEQFLLSGIKPVLIPTVAGGDWRERAGLEEHHMKNVRKHSTCRRAGMFFVFNVKFSFFPLCRKRSWLYTIADQSKTLQRPNLSSSCPARCHLSNSDQSCLGEATAKGLTTVAHKKVHNSCLDFLW